MKNDYHRVEKFISNPKKALFTLAWPIILAMLVQVAYNIVDTIFVGKLGADAIAAITFAFPVFFVFMALNAGVGIGMSSLISRFLGSKKKSSAENTTVHGLIISLFFALLLFIFGIIFLNPILSLFGAEQPVLGLAYDYLFIILFGLFFMFLGNILNNVFTGQGDTKTPMIIQVTSLLLNIILDPILIYGLDMGVRGAALATSIAFFVWSLMAVFFIKKKSVLKINFKVFKFSKQIIKNIFVVGIPASLMMLLMSVFLALINRLLAGFGTNYVASLGIVFRLESVATMPIVGFSIALVTLVGMFFGAKRYDLLKDIVFYSLKIAVSIVTVISVILFAFPELFIKIFTNDSSLISLASAYLRIEVFVFPFMATGMIIGRVLQGMGYGMPALVISFVRLILVAVPLAYVFVEILGYGYLSIAVSILIAAVCANIISWVFLFVKFRKLKN